MPTTYSRKPASHLRSAELHPAFFSDHFSISLTSLSSGCILKLTTKSCGPLSRPSHHPDQTPSLCPFISEFVPVQIQVLQSRILSQAFGQGLTGETWTSSPALLIKLCPLSLPFSRISPADWLFNQRIRDTIETRIRNINCPVGIQYGFFVTSSFLKFDQTQPRRDILICQIKIQSKPQPI